MLSIELQLFEVAGGIMFCVRLGILPSVHSYSNKSCSQHCKSYPRSTHALGVVHILRNQLRGVGGSK